VTRSKSEIFPNSHSPGSWPIVRAQQLTQVVPMFEALIAGGISATEITMTTPMRWLQFAKRARRSTAARWSESEPSSMLRAAARRLTQGRNHRDTICRPELVAISHAAQRPIMLGAYTPTEAQLAHEAGADFVKIFPADTLGPAFVKALLAPLPHLRIVPTGGVDANNLGDFFGLAAPRWEWVLRWFRRGYFRRRLVRTNQAGERTCHCRSEGAQRLSRKW